MTASPKPGSTEGPLGFARIPGTGGDLPIITIEDTGKASVESLQATAERLADYFAK